MQISSCGAPNPSPTVSFPRMHASDPWSCPRASPKTQGPPGNPSFPWSYGGPVGALQTVPHKTPLAIRPCRIRVHEIPSRQTLEAPRAPLYGPVAVLQPIGIPPLWRTRLPVSIGHDRVCSAGYLQPCHGQTSPSWDSIPTPFRVRTQYSPHCKALTCCVRQRRHIWVSDDF